jgi:hypothetical protein
VALLLGSLYKLIEDKRMILKVRELSMRECTFCNILPPPRIISFKETSYLS